MTVAPAGVSPPSPSTPARDGATAAAGATAPWLLTRTAVSLILPVTTLAPAVGPLGTGARLLLAVVVAACVLHRPGRLRIPQALLLLLFVALLLALAVGAPSPAYGAARLVNWVMFVPLVFLGSGRGHLRAVGRSLFLTCWLQVGGVLLQLAGLLGGTWGGLLTSGTTHDPSRHNWLTRYTGFLGNPNDLGLLLSLGAMLCVLAVAMGSSRGTLPVGRTFVMLISAGVFVLGVFLSGSRGAILGLVIGVVVSMAFLSGRQRLVVGCFAGAATALVLTDDGAFRRVVGSVGEIVAGEDSSAASRAAQWLDRLGAGGPWFVGDGFGGYARNAVLTRDGVGIDTAVHQSATVDNSWLKLYLEGGVLGVTILALLLCALILPVVTRHVEDRLAAAVVVTSAAMLVWRSLSVDVLDINPWNAVIWLLAGLAVGLVRYTERASQADPAMPILARG
ncbi:O-antigen ligase [Georgenia sp. SYP-B2076]|uniref:O-antigen ligase family protein n=1 Tax=Georgenia sp. SYP-B2076 TaxID=2495881 RepID=UPI000F8CE5BA|nr:O-antigen ligase family protein [Georgenia sp. SYP-B2076]